jgi:hypothetical protein
MKNILNPKIIRLLLIFLNGVLAITALAGGVGLLTGASAPPVDLLLGSPFTTYSVPGLALFVLVGGSALIAAICLIRGHSCGLIASGIAGAMIICFETVEVWVIGSPPGIARALQIFYLLLGAIMILLTGAGRSRDNKAE